MKQLFYQDLMQKLPDLHVLVDEPLKNHTTFRIGGAADYLITPSEEQLPAVLAIAKEHELPVTVIGNGSNLLVSDRGVRGVVLEIAKSMSGVTVDGNYIDAQAGALLAKVAGAAAEHGLSGLEFAAGIPGSMGGAVVMNAGAYGGEMKDVLVFVKILTAEGDILTIPAEEMDLSYRHSCVPEKGYIVLGARMLLHPAPEAQIRAQMAELREKRIEKQPLEYASAGSTFKRPEGYFAGKLIMDAGLRGYRVGDAQVSEKHCGFVINRGNATAAEVMQLVHDVQQKVYEQFQVRLEPEIKKIGEWEL